MKKNGIFLSGFLCITFPLCAMHQKHAQRINLGDNEWMKTVPWRLVATLRIPHKSQPVCIEEQPDEKFVDRFIYKYQITQLPKFRRDLIQEWISKNPLTKEAALTLLVQKHKLSFLVNRRSDNYISNDPFWFDLVCNESEFTENQAHREQLIINKFVDFILSNQNACLQDDLEGFYLKTIGEEGWGLENNKVLAHLVQTFLLHVLNNPIENLKGLPLQKGATLLEVAFWCQNYDAAMLLAFYGASNFRD